jgi:hypothetical protein
MRVGIVCEGSTDFEVFKALIVALIGSPNLRLVLLQPDFDALRGKRMEQGTGWQAVRKYLRSPAFPVTVSGYDLVVVQVDADIRKLPEVNRQLAAEPSGDELEALCAHVKSWMAGGVPPNAIVALPREATEAWLLAMHSRKTDVEGVVDPAQAMADAGLIASTERGPDKKSTRYAELTEPLVRALKDQKLLRKLPELERFVGKVHSAAQRRRRESKTLRSS